MNGTMESSGLHRGKEEIGLALGLVVGEEMGQAYEDTLLRSFSFFTWGSGNNYILIFIFPHTYPQISNVAYTFMLDVQN